MPLASLAVVPLLAVAALPQDTGTARRSLVHLPPPLVASLADVALPQDPGVPQPPPQAFSSRDTYLFEGIALGIAAGFLLTWNGEGSVTMALVSGAMGGFIGSNMEKRSRELGPEVLDELRTPGAEAAELLPPELLAVQEALNAGQVTEAVAQATRYTTAHPDDPRGFLLLGDAQVAAARSDDAVAAYAEADFLTPEDPEPSYRVARLALLRGDEGLARTALTHVLEVAPLYRDAWTRWLVLYRDSDARRAMITTLTPHAADPAVKALIATLRIEEERYPDADRLLDAALATDSAQPAWLALRAQSAFEAGDTLTGVALYQRALAHAARDTVDALWRQVVGIASPAEIRAWQAGVEPEAKGAWLQNFWARRNPNLFAGVNLRVAEHFQRLRSARGQYPLLHPLSLYQRSAEGRALNLEPSTGERQFHLQCEVLQIPEQPLSSGWGVARLSYGPGPVDIRYKPIGGGEFWWLTGDELDQVRRMFMLRAGLPPDAPATALGREFDARYFDPSSFVPFGFDLRGADSTAARVGYNVATGLSDRGVALLRLGAPDRQLMGGDNALHYRCGTTELERWRYGQWGELRFSRPSAFSEGERTVGEMVFRPMEEPQFAAMQLALSTDATSIPAPLEFGVWTAQFRNARDPRLSDVVVVSTRGALATSLIGPTGAEQELRQSARGIAMLTSEPGAYALLAHAQDSGQLGRQHFALDLRGYDTLPALSDLLVSAPWGDGTIDRAAMLAHLGRGLAFASGDTVRTYAELYGLASDGGSVWYRVTYLLLETGNVLKDYAKEEWPDAQRFTFERQLSADPRGVTIESLDLQPQWIPEGRYLLRLEVEDLVADTAAGRATIAFEVK